MFKCVLCNCDRYEVVASRNQIRFECYGYDKQIVKCANCKLVQLTPFWTNEELNVLYSGYHNKEDFKGQIKERNISEYVSKYFGYGDRILEVGCGMGDTVRYFRILNYDATGIDLDPTVCDGYIVLQKDFLLDDIETKYDFIYALHVLEHIKYPFSFVEKILESLNSNGKFFLEVPCISDPLLSLYQNSSYNRFYWYPYHLIFWDFTNIQRMMNSFPVQCKIKRVQRYGILNHLRWLFFGKPSNSNRKIPILDNLYSFILTRIFKVCDTLQIVGTKL